MKLVAVRDFVRVNCKIWELIFPINIKNEAVSRGAGAQSVIVNRLVMGPIPTQEDEIFIYIYIFISFLWCRAKGKARRWVPPLNTKCLQKLAESGERSILILGSLCLPCCVRNTAWSWKKKRKSQIITFSSVHCLSDTQ